MAKSAWYDVAMRGRRLEAIMKDCNTKYWKYKDNHEIAELYFDRMMKVEKSIQPYVAEYLGVKKLLKAVVRVDSVPELVSG